MTVPWTRTRCRDQQQPCSYPSRHKKGSIHYSESLTAHKKKSKRITRVVQRLARTGALAWLTHFIKRMLPGEYCTKSVFTRPPQPTQRGPSPAACASPIGDFFRRRPAYLAPRAVQVQSPASARPPTRSPPPPPPPLGLGSARRCGGAFVGA